MTFKTGKRNSILIWDFIGVPTVNYTINSSRRPRSVLQAGGYVQSAQLSQRQRRVITKTLNGSWPICAIRAPFIKSRVGPRGGPYINQTHYRLHCLYNPSCRDNLKNRPNINIFLGARILHFYGSTSGPRTSGFQGKFADTKKTYTKDSHGFSGKHDTLSIQPNQKHTILLVKAANNVALRCHLFHACVDPISMYLRHS